MRTEIKIAAGLILAASLGFSAGAAPKKRSARRPASPSPIQSSNKVVIKTSDGTEFRGTLLEREDLLITFKTTDGEDIHLPVDELVSINGQAPAAYFKHFVPVIPESLFQIVEFSPNPKVRCSFNFLSNWAKSNLPSGLIFAAPDDDKKWEGSRLHFVLESPPKIAGDLSYQSVLKKIADAGSSVLNQSYGTVGSTRSLLTTEVNSNSGQVSKSIWQIRDENGEKCLLQVSLVRKDKEKLEQTLSDVILNGVANSVRFKKP